MRSEAVVLQVKTKGSKAFQIQKINVNNLCDDQLQVDSEAFGLNYADVMASLGMYREAPSRPAVIGYELVGKVIAVGNNVSPSWIGKRVLAFSRFGAYGRIVNVEKYAIAEVQNEPVVELLALCTQGVTAYYMTHFVSPLRKNDIALIHSAAGGVGTMLIQLCKLIGVTTIAKVSSAEKEKITRSLGADFTINYTSETSYEQQVEQLIGRKKLTVSFNPVAGSTFKKDMSLLGFGGRMFLFGGAEMTKGKWGILSTLQFIFKMGRPLPIAHMMKSQSIIGVNMLKIADYQPEVMTYCLQECYKLYSEGKLKPINGGIYSIHQFELAFAKLQSGKSAGKIAVTWMD